MWIFLNAKRPKLIPVMGQLGTYRVELPLGFGVPHGHIQSSHFQRPCVVYEELFLPFFRGIHIPDSYDAGLPAPFWASSLEKPRHCRPNFAQHRTSGVGQKLSRLCVYVGEILDGGPPKPCGWRRPLSIFWTRWRFAPTTGQVQCHSALVSSRVV